jgi:membrane protease YdiL (CAAX protease family)
MPDPPTHRQTVVLLAILVEGGLIVLAWSLGWLLGPLPLDSFSWSTAGALWGLLATVPMLALFLLMLRWPVGPLLRIKRFSEEVLRPLLAPCSVLDLLGISVLAGLGEEMLFRGVLQRAFADWMRNPWPALVLASVLFGLLHAVTLTYALLATLMGAYLGWLWHYTGNLLPAVIAHALYDFLALLFLLRGPEPPEPPGETGEGAVAEKTAHEPADGAGDGAEPS